MGGGICRYLSSTAIEVIACIPTSPLRVVLQGCVRIFVYSDFRRTIEERNQARPVSVPRLADGQIRLVPFSSNAPKRISASSAVADW